MMTLCGGSPDRQRVGVQEDQQNITDGIAADGRAMVTQSLEASDRYPGR